MDAESDLIVRQLDVGDLDRFVTHSVRQARESGREGAPIFNPFSIDHVWDPDDVRKSEEGRWSREVGSPDWARVWAVIDGADVIGSLQLSGGSIRADQHRALLMMGIEREYHRRGLGLRLLSTCVEWALGRPSLTWIDLGVFSHNTAAIALYRRVGFKEVATTRDRFRVDGRSIDDISMTLALDELRAAGSTTSN